MSLSQTKKLLPCDPAFLQARSSRLRPRESTHEKPTHDLMRIVSSAAAKAAQAQSLHLCDALVPNQKASRVRPGFSPGPRTPCHTTPYETNNRTPQAGVHGRQRKPCLASLLKIGAKQFLRQTSQRERHKGVDAGEAGWSCRHPLRDTRRGRLAGGRKAGSELGEDAHGELWMRGHGDG